VLCCGLPRGDILVSNEFTLLDHFAFLKFFLNAGISCRRYPGIQNLKQHGYRRLKTTGTTNVCEPLRSVIGITLRFFVPEVEPSPLVQRSFIGPLYQPGMIDYGCGTISGRKPKYSEITCLSGALTTTGSTHHFSRARTRAAAVGSNFTFYIYVRQRRQQVKRRLHTVWMSTAVDLAANWPPNLILLTTSHLFDLHQITITARKSAALWDVTPCGSCKNRRFRGTEAVAS
jgi:hypothetical protein